MKVLLAANWKMNKTPAEAREWARVVREGFRGEAELTVLPSFPLIASVAEELSGSPVAWGAQDASAHDWGAFTGETSAGQLAALGCRYVAVGHSERRQYWHEGNELVAQKAARVLAAGMVPIICVGEDLAIREAGEAVSHTTSQLRQSLNGLEVKNPANLVVAYEPVWAIGTGRVATPDDAQEMSHELRKVLAELGVAEARILYGGSVKPGNWAAILAGEDVDGALVGGASLEAESFLALAAESRG